MKWFDARVEDGTLNEFDYTNVTEGYGAIEVSSERLLEGNYSVKSVITPRSDWTSAAAMKNVQALVGAPQPVVHARILIEVGAFSGEFMRGFIYLRGTEGAQAMLGLRSGPLGLALELFYFNGTEYTYLPSTARLQVGSRYLAEIRIVVGVGTGEIRVLLEDVEVPDLTVTSLDNSLHGDIVLAGFGILDGYNTGITLFSDAAALGDSHIGPVVPPTLTHQLTVTSTPVTGVPFTITKEGIQTSYVTDWTGTKEEGTYEIEAPSNVIVDGNTYNLAPSEAPVRTVNLLADETVSFSYVLTAVTAIDVHAFLDGNEVTTDALIVETGQIFQTPLTIEVSPGTYSIEVSLEGFNTYIQQVTVSAGQTFRVDAKFVSPTPIPPIAVALALGIPIGAVILGLLLK